MFVSTHPVIDAREDTSLPVGYPVMRPHSHESNVVLREKRFLLGRRRWRGLQKNDCPEGYAYV
jgi:hypothetical protein